MRTTVPDRLEAGRILLDKYRSRKSDGVRGSFWVVGPLGRELFVTSSGRGFAQFPAAPAPKAGS